MRGRYQRKREYVTLAERYRQWSMKCSAWSSGTHLPDMSEIVLFADTGEITEHRGTCVACGKEIHRRWNVDPWVNRSAVEFWEIVPFVIQEQP